MNNEKRVVEYLQARGASFSGERIGKSGMLTFALPGEANENGRLLAKRDGSVSVWHVGAKNGLNLGAPWNAGDKKIIGSREVASFTLTPETAAALAPPSSPQPLHKVDLKSVAPTKYIYDQGAFENAVTRELEAAGWKYEYERGGLQYWNDGTGSTAAERVKIGDGIATVWSFRHDVDMPSPWKQGRDTSYGNKAMFVTARDLGIQSVGVSHQSHITPTNHEPSERQPVSVDVVKLVRDSWAAGPYAPDDHPQLNKAGAKLNSALLKTFPDNETTRQKHLAGDLIAPLFRGDGKGGVELVGAQRLMRDSYKGNDKMLLAGTQAAGAFMPVPPFPLMMENPDIGAWIKQLGPQATKRPLVIAEGVATGIAIHQSCAGNVLVAISSGNLPTVAQWVKDSGLANHFPEGVVIAADLDTSRGIDGKLKSNAIPKAIHAAEILDGKVALADSNHNSGTDARDLMGAGGIDEVRRYISEALTPAQVSNRTDVFPHKTSIGATDIKPELGR